MSNIYNFTPKDKQGRENLRTFIADLSKDVAGLASAVPQLANGLKAISVGVKHYLNEMPDDTIWIRSCVPAISKNEEKIPDHLVTESTIIYGNGLAGLPESELFGMGSIRLSVRFDESPRFAALATENAVDIISDWFIERAGGEEIPANQVTMFGYTISAAKVFGFQLDSVSYSDDRDKIEFIFITKEERLTVKIDFNHFRLTSRYLKRKAEEEKEVSETTELLEQVETILGTVKADIANGTLLSNDDVKRLKELSAKIINCRDNAIRESVKNGYPQNTLAERWKLTPARISQIVSEDPK
jgi:hypothetical protein